MINKAILTGRLTSVPELKTTVSGISVLSFSIAVQRQYKDATGMYPTDFINIVAWRNTAEFISKNFEKGQHIAIVGSIETRPYIDKDGNKRTAVEVVADEAHFVESKKDTQDTSNCINQSDEVIVDDLPF